MKKEAWILKEIENWKENNTISEETAAKIKSLYQTEKKNSNPLIVLFSIMGFIFIGFGILLLSSTNWWAAFPLTVKACIGISPFLISQIIVVFVHRRKMESTAFRESASLLNVACVFASVALIVRIFGVSADFSDYMLVCSLLFLPNMLILKACSPLVVYYWSSIVGMNCFSEMVGIIVAVSMFSVGAAFALSMCREKSGKGIFLSMITAIFGMRLILIMALFYCGCDLSISLYGYILLLLSAAPMLKGAEAVFKTYGRICFLVLTLVVTYRGLWDYVADCSNTGFLLFSVFLLLFATVLFVKNIVAKRYCLISAVTVFFIVLRGLWCIFELSVSPFDLLFMIMFNVILLALSVFCILDGTRKMSLYNANMGMAALCALSFLRFMDSDLSVVTRGFAFLIIGAGFLLFNLYFAKKKKI